MKKLRYILLFLSALTFHSCTEPVSSLPARPVGIQINTNQDFFVHFQPVNLYDYVIADAEGLHYHNQIRRYQEGHGAHGYGGVIIIVTGSELNPYASFDMACPACSLSTGKCHVTQMDGFFMVCPDCNERYDMTAYGVPTKGKSKERLKQYNTHVVNGVIRISN